MEISALGADGNAKWLFMKEIPISEFRTRCSRLIGEVSKTKQSIRITRRGKPVAEIHPVSPRAGDWIGAMKDSIEIIGDIVGLASGEDEWEALRGDIQHGTELPDRGELLEGAEVFREDPKEKRAAKAWR